MPPHVIVSYDGTDNDQDALALGRLFAEAGARLGLAYVRHSQEREHHREEFAQDEAEELLAVGARRLEPLDVETHVVVSASTAEGLRVLAVEAGVDLIVFGSGYRTPPGRLRPNNTTVRLLDGGPTAIAIAIAGMRVSVQASLALIRIVGEDVAARETASGLAGAFGASVTEQVGVGADLLVVASRPEAGGGTVGVNPTVLHTIEDAACPVLVVARGAPLRFGAPVASG